MILATCIVSTFATQRGAHNIAAKGDQSQPEQMGTGEHVLVPVSHAENIDELVGLGIAVTKQKHRSLYALNAIDNRIDDPEVQKRSQKLLDKAVTAAAAANIHMHSLQRYDVNIVNAIVGIVRERNITDLVLGMHREANASTTGQPDEGGLLGTNSMLSAGGVPALGKTIPDVLTQCNVTTFIYRAVQPLATVQRHIVLVPRKAELEAGFQTWMLRIRHLAHDTGAKIVFHGMEQTVEQLRRKRRRSDIAAYITHGANESWEELLAAQIDALQPDDCLWVVMSRRDRISYQPGMGRTAGSLEERVRQNNYIMIYPVQAGETESRYI